MNAVCFAGGMLRLEPKRAETAVESLEVRTLLNGEYDAREAIVTIRSGALTAAINPFGAELTHLRDADGRATGLSILVKRIGPSTSLLYDARVGDTVACLGPLGQPFTLVDAHGELVVCSREENAELFALAAGGYGLFGCVVDVTMRLVPRRTLERVVEVRQIVVVAHGCEAPSGDGPGQG